ncbi:MAG: O-sialoglycoprotein endopeptidase [Clostridiales bacterium]
MILSLDTSCYTTSVALVATEGDLLADKRRVLDVPLGQRGLAQSEALFQHIRNIPTLIESLAADFDFGKIKAIGVSTQPRPLENSYMPVFLGGENAARNLAAALKVPLFRVSHQEGHMAAGLGTVDFCPAIGEKFLMCHFSGGTSEIHQAVKIKEGEYEFTLIAATNDLHAGQFVDRIGVKLGLKFPTGKELEKLAAKATGEIPKLPTYCQNGEFSFSGQETAIESMLKKGTTAEVAARCVEETLGRTFKKALIYATEKTNAETALMVGGVTANQYVKTYLIEKISHCNLFFTPPKFATDNAVGVGRLALARYMAKK